jgi:hypothetical protein
MEQKVSTATLTMAIRLQSQYFYCVSYRNDRTTDGFVNFAKLVDAGSALDIPGAVNGPYS